MITVLLLSSSDWIYYFIPSKIFQLQLIIIILIFKIATDITKKTTLQQILTVILFSVFTLASMLYSLESVATKYAVVTIAILFILAFSETLNEHKLFQQIVIFQKISLLSLIGGQIYFQLVNDPLFTFTAPDNRPVFLYLFTLSNTPDYMPILRPSFIFDEPGTLVFVSMLQYAIVCMLKKGVPHSLFVLNFLLSFSTTGLAIAILIIIYRAFSRSGLMFKLFGMVSILSISFFSQNKIRAELNFDEIGRANLILRSFLTAKVMYIREQC